MNDEPLMSPRRLYYSIAWYFWWKRIGDPTIPIGLWWLVRMYRRPNAAKGRY